MHPLSAQAVLRVWEQTQNREPIDCALALLSAANPEATRDQLAALSLAERDQRLLALRELTFGAHADAWVECQRCGSRLEFSLATSTMQPANQPPPAPLTLDLEEWHLEFRLPNSSDLEEAARQHEPAEARRCLLRRCITQGLRYGAPVTPAELPASLAKRVAKRMAEQHPLAEVQIQVVCPTCGHSCQVLFDIASFFWEEVRDEAQRLLRQVHFLARAYGWREQDILALSPVRRQAYLEMVE